MSASGSGFKWQTALNAVVVVCALLGVIAWYTQQVKLGTKYAFSPKETVNYSGTVTEPDAKALGEALKTYGFFDGETEKDVLFKKGPEGTVVSFVLQEGKWDDPDVVGPFQSGLATEIAPAVGGVPFKIEFLDNRLNSKKILQIDRLERSYHHTAQEKVFYFTPVTLEQATALGKALQEAGYFDNTAPADVLLEKLGDKMMVSFMVGEGKWDEESVVTFFSKLGKQVAPVLTGETVTVQLIDKERVPKKAISLE